MNQLAPLTVPNRVPHPRPRLGFLGVGWIGRKRLEAIQAEGCAEIVGLADASEEALRQAARVVPHSRQVRTLEELLALELDGVVVATPSALHAEQAMAALQRKVAVFCQKPLARNAGETRCVIEAARQSGCLLGVDLSYRHMLGMQLIKHSLAQGEIGRVYDVDLVFHNAYGPDKAWFYRPELSGGGCVMDLGTHLVDLAMWSLGRTDITSVSSRLFSQGSPWQAASGKVEDFAWARLDLGSDCTVQMACSWKLPVGVESVIRATFHGTAGALEIRNLEGSFYHFITERFEGTQRQILAGPPDEWGGRAAVDWAQRLARGEGYHEEVELLIDVATVLENIYGRQLP